MTYAFFDFDGTLTTKDTLRGFAKYYWKKRYKWKFLTFLPVYAAYRLGVIGHNKTKAKFIKHFYYQASVDDLYAKGREYSQHEIHQIIQPAMLARLKWHIDQSHTVVIVTASLPYWLKYWCEQQGVALLSTEAEEVDGKISGQLNGNNCFGHEKVLRIKRRYDIQPNDSIYAYGDTKSDFPMLDLARFAFDCSNNTTSPYTLVRKESWYAQAIQ